MAQIESSAIGTGRKSLGNITYRHLNGDTIASQRVTRNNSRTPKQIAQRDSFATTVNLFKALKPLVVVGFEKTKPHSPYNLFMKSNKSYMNYIKTKTDFDMEQPALLNLYEALSDEGFTGKVVIANGTTTLTSVFNISNDKKLTGTLYFGRDFQSGDTITVGICHTYQLANTQFEAIKLCSKTLTEQEVAALSVKSQFVINDTTFPNIDPFGFLPTGYTNVHTVLTAIVVNETDRSHSFMQLADGDDGF